MNTPQLPSTTPQWLYDALARHEDIERELGGGQLRDLPHDAGLWFSRAVAMLDVCLPTSGQPIARARVGAEDAMFAMMMAGICLGRVNEASEEYNVN